MPPRQPNLTAEQRHALTLLDSTLHGVTKDQLVIVHEFDRAMIVGLVQTGLATKRRETMEAGGGTIEVIRITITDAGRRALAG